MHFSLKMGKRIVELKLLCAEPDFEGETTEIIPQKTRSPVFPIARLQLHQLRLIEVKSNSCCVLKRLLTWRVFLNVLEQNRRSSVVLYEDEGSRRSHFGALAGPKVRGER